MLPPFVLVVKLCLVFCGVCCRGSVCACCQQHFSCSVFWIDQSNTSELLIPGRTDRQIVDTNIVITQKKSTSSGLQLRHSARDLVCTCLLYFFFNFFFFFIHSLFSISTFRLLTLESSTELWSTLSVYHHRHNCRC